MKITRRQLRTLISEQYTAMADGGFSPMKSRASEEFVKLIKGAIHEADHDDSDWTETLASQVDAEIGRAKEPGLSSPDRQDLIDDLTMDLVNLLNQTNYVDLDINDLAGAVFDALSYNDLISRDDVAKAFGKAVYRHDDPGY